MFATTFKMMWDKGGNDIEMARTENQSEKPTQENLKKKKKTNPSEVGRANQCLSDLDKINPCGGK